MPHSHRYAPARGRCGCDARIRPVDRFACPPRGDISPLVEVAENERHGEIGHHPPTQSRSSKNAADPCARGNRAPRAGFPVCRQPPAADEFHPSIHAPERQRLVFYPAHEAGNRPDRRHGYPWRRPHGATGHLRRISAQQQRPGRNPVRIAWGRRGRSVLTVRPRPDHGGARDDPRPLAPRFPRCVRFTHKATQRRYTLSLA